MTPSGHLDTDPRWQGLFSDQAALAEQVGRWQVDQAVPEGIADVLRVARALLVDSYHVYEYSLVAITWSLLAAEASLHGCLPVEDEQQDRRTFSTLVTQAKDRGLITKKEAGVLYQVVGLRNDVVHRGYLRPKPSPQSYSPHDVMEYLEAIHLAVSDIYHRAADARSR